MGDTKLCGTCGQRQALDQFNRSARSKDGRQSRCRSCSRAWYVANRVEHIANTARRTRQVREEYHSRIAQYLQEHACVDCGEADVVVLEFDHREAGTKVREVARLVSDLVGWEKVEAEIAKCDVCCANCHRRRTAARGDQRRHRYEQGRRAVERGAAQQRLVALLPPRG